MRVLTFGGNPGPTAWRGTAVLAAAVLLTSTSGLAAHAAASPAPPTPAGTRLVSFHGYQIAIPRRWRVVDLTAEPRACLRFDKPVLYVGTAGDQAACPGHLIGGAPGLQVQALTAASLGGGLTPLVTLAPGADPHAVRLPRTGPVNVAVEGAGVLLTAMYGGPGARAVGQAVAAGAVLADAQPTLVSSLPPAQTAPALGASEPGSFLGMGFDTCAAPSQAVMDAWLATSGYASFGIYLGGVNRGCAQPNLTAGWVASQVSKGWHLLPAYVGVQAPCTGFHNRMSYDVLTARAEGRTEAADAATEADALGLAAPSTIYADVESYDSSDPSCVAAVLAYVAGWNYALHSRGYEAGVYSSASTGIHDLSLHYNAPGFGRPDDIWMAWWNDQADVDGGSYVPAGQWSSHRRAHQYAGNEAESHGGYALTIDRDYLDVSAAVPPPKGCPSNLDFTAYRTLELGYHGAEVTAAQCLLASSGFDPGDATGVLGWRTAAAVRSFKAAIGMTSDDSSIRQWVWMALLSAGSTPFLHLGSTGSEVRRVQRALTARLQRTVAISGTFDTATRSAVIAYQQTARLTPTGTVGAVTWHALQSGR